MPNISSGVDYTDNGGGSYTFTNANPIAANVQIDYLDRSADQQLSALNELGLSLGTGLIGQPVWPWLQSAVPQQALGYSGLAYVYADGYQLTNQAEVENHSFEVVTGHAVSTTVPDVWPHIVLREFLVSHVSSVGWAANRLAPLTQFVNYVQARKLWLSVQMSAQKPARDWLQSLATLCNAEWVWQGGLLDLVPRADEPLSSEYGSYTPNTTPVFDLVHGEGGDLLGPVEIEPVLNEDAHNVVLIEWTNRGNNYATEVMTASDQAHIEQFGQRPAGVEVMHAIHDASVAMGVAQQMLQREMTVWSQYRFKVPFSRGLIGLMDLVTLTDADSNLDRVPVRITGRSESGTLEYTYEAEDAPIGSASAPIYGAQAGAGFAHDYNQAPGPITAPFFFEPPVQLTNTGLEVWVALSGQTNRWGGSRVWVSSDGINYKMVGGVAGGARYGALNQNLGIGAADTLDVALTGQGGQMLSGSAADAATNQTLVFVGDALGGEYINYQTATLTAAQTYKLTQLQRGAYYTTAKARLANQATVVRVDNAVGKSQPLIPSQIGQLLYFKFTSFNVYGGGEQDLASVPVYTYTPTGYMLKNKLPPVQNLVFDGVSKFTWSSLNYPRNLLAGYKAKFQYGKNQSWEDAVPMNSDVITDSPYIASIVPQGNVTFMLRAVDIYGNESASSATVVTQLGDPVTANVVAAQDYKVAGWPGTITGSVSVTGGDIVATNSAAAFGAFANAVFSAIASDSAFASQYNSISYTTPLFAPAAAGRMTLLYTAQASQYQVNYRPANPAPALAGSGLQAAFGQGALLAAFAAPPDWLVWPGAIAASTQPYQFQIVCGIGTVQQQITRLIAQVDVPDINLRLTGVDISAAGTRLVGAVGKFSAISNVNLTLQGGNTAIDAQFTDRSSTLGPNIICINLAGAQVAGVVDVLLQGY